MLYPLSIALHVMVSGCLELMCDCFAANQRATSDPAAKSGYVYERALTWGFRAVACLASEAGVAQCTSLAQQCTTAIGQCLHPTAVPTLGDRPSVRARTTPAAVSESMPLSLAASLAALSELHRVARLEPPPAELFGAMLRASRLQPVKGSKNVQLVEVCRRTMARIFCPTSNADEAAPIKTTFQVWCAERGLLRSRILCVEAKQSRLLLL